MNLSQIDWAVVSGIVTALVGITIFIFFLYIKPEYKTRIERAHMLDEVAKGDYVEMISGLRGIVHKIFRKSKEIEIDCEGIILVYSLESVNQVIKKGKGVRDDNREVLNPDSDTDDTNNTESLTDETNK